MLRKNRLKWIAVFFSAGTILLLAFLLSQKQNSIINPPLTPNVISEPESGQSVAKDELVILDSNQLIQRVVKEFNGEITVAVPETSSYQVKFPVANFDELTRIKNELNRRGINAMYVNTIIPPSPEEPQ